jgi:hypothetical protein
MSTAGQPDSLDDALDNIAAPGDAAAPSAEEIEAAAGVPGESPAEPAYEAPAPRPRSSTPARKPANVPAQSAINSRKLLVKAVFVLTAVMAIPALWAVCILAGVPGVPMSGRGDAAVTMAKIMLVCWPIAGLLLFFGLLMAKDVKRMEAQVAKYKKR